jgi:hypothetical protein
LFVLHPAVGIRDFGAVKVVRRIDGPCGWIGEMAFLAERRECPEQEEKDVQTMSDHAENPLK